MKTLHDCSTLEHAGAKPAWRAAAISSLLLGMAVLAAVMMVNPAPAFANQSADPAAGTTDVPARMDDRRDGLQRRTRVASLGNERPPAPSSLSGASVHRPPSPDCHKPTLRGVLQQVAASFGAVTVNSTCRSRSHNALVGGARHSHHLAGNAVDFRIDGKAGATLAFLRSSRAVGGLKHYGGGLFHIDTGPRRTW